MASDAGDHPSRIGATLKEERGRQGLDISAVEELTKIRAKYLRALENEDWEVLPGAAYVRGFLRTYAGTLGLDAEALVDEYRTRFEGSGAEPYGIAERVLTERRPLDAREPRRLDRRVVVGLLVAGLAVILLVLGLAGGSDDDGEGDAEPQNAAERQGQAGGVKGGGDEDKAAVPQTVDLELVARSDSEVCLVTKGGAVVLDNDLMAEGDEESFEADEFELGLGFGVVEVTVNGKGERLEADPDTPVKYEITPRGVRRPAPDANPECP